MPILSVILAVVLGLITLSFMGGDRSTKRMVTHLVSSSFKLNLERVIPLTLKIGI
ncbi:MAG: hypothetical protein HC833_04445 [Leptolyngbyaceae cyanobacterium RM1_406_9]|nr:hypothetical protein [Leptolyngbyaceae cyanobacterium RM1_406_9]